MIIKIDISNAFNSTCRALTLDILSGRASRDYECGLKRGDAIATSDTLSNMFGYFQAMRTCHAKLRYFDWDGLCRLARGLTGGQQGDPLAASGVQHAQSNRGQFHFKRAAFFSQLKAKAGLVLVKAAALRITLNIDDAPIASRSHTHPSHSQPSRLLTSSLSLGIPVIPVPRRAT